MTAAVRALPDVAGAPPAAGLHAPAPAPATVASPGVYLRRYLAPLGPLLERPDVTDILVQAPGEAWVEGAPGVERFAVPALTEPLIVRLAQALAGASAQAVSRAHPLLAASLPTGERVQVVLPPATRGFPVLSVRRHAVVDVGLDDYARSGAFATTRRATPARALDATLARLLAAGDHAGFLRTAVRGRRTILVSGGTGSGKTTFMNALLKEIAADERLVAIEDTPELRLAHANSVGLVAVRGDQGEARVTVEDLLQASLRLRPDRILVGELRGREAVTFLRAVNTGHPGSVSTIHADTCQGALEQLVLMALEAGLALGRAEILAYARGVIDVVVQLERDGGVRRVAEVMHVREG